MTAPTARSTQPTRASEPRTYPVSLMVYYPEGTGLTRGSVVLRTAEKVYYDYFTIRKDPEHSEFDEKVSSAVTSILRTTPNRPVKYMLLTGNRREYGQIKARLDAILKATNLNVSYGGSGNDYENLSHLARYAANAVQWEDMHNARHLYISTVSNGEVHYTYVVSVTQRTIVWKRVRTVGSDALAANLSAIRDTLSTTTDRSEIAVWCNTEIVNRLLRREKNILLSKEAAATAAELISAAKSREIGVTYNALHKMDVARFSQFVATTDLNAHLTAQLQETVQTRKKPA